MVEFKFTLDNVFTRRMEYNFLPGAMPETISQAARVEVSLLTKNSASVLVGIKAENGATPSNDSLASFTCVVEVVAIVNFDKDLPNILDAKQLPMLSHIMAIIFPFVRERVSSCLSSSNLPIVIQPVNMHTTLSELDGDAITLHDFRNSALTDSQSNT